MVSDLEELKQSHDALEAVVRELEHRLTMDEYQLNNVIQMGPPKVSADPLGSDGERPSERDTWLQNVDSMLRSIGLHQGFHANHLKDVEKELKRVKEELANLQARQGYLYAAVVGPEGPVTAIAEGIQCVERKITELAERRTS
jgi:predicted  nucleic acid-binding Zn-ribbon protein